jgi:hypothetical protein
MSRVRLPNRREALTTDLAVGARFFKATVGFDDAGQPKELFLSGAKHGSDLACLLDDAAVAISVALQHGVSAQALAVSISRVPGVPDALPRAASAIGGALDLVAQFELEA